MSHLDEPLGQQGSVGSTRRGYGIWLAAAVVVVVGAAGSALVWMNVGDGGVPDGATRVAIGEEAVVQAPAPSVEVEPETVVIDGLTVRKLSPLEGNEDLAPTDEADGAAPAPTRPSIQRVEPARRNVPKGPVGRPLPALAEASEFGTLPRIARDGLRPFDAYSVPGTSGVSARIAVVVTGLGLSQTGTLTAINALPPSVTLAFSPFGNSLNRWMLKARQGGHETVLQLPMEPLGYPTIDPGPRTLTSVAPRGANLANLRWALGRMTNYPLVMNYLGAGLTTKRGAMEPLLDELNSRGLGYFDDGTVRASIVPVLSKQKRMPNGRGFLTLDSRRDKASIESALAQLEVQAKQRGFAAGTATAFPETIDVISAWVKAAQARGVVIVPVSNLLRDYSR